MGFSRGHQGRQGCQGHRPHNDDDNNKDDINDKGISVPGLDRDLGFLRGHQGHQPHVFCHKMCNFKDNYGEHLYNNNNISSRLS